MTAVAHLPDVHTDVHTNVGAAPTFPMPLYLCRWPNGDCSVVCAANKGEAVEILDEVDNAECCSVMALRDFMVHFRMSDEGEIQSEVFGEATEDALFQLAYPVDARASQKLSG